MLRFVLRLIAATSLLLASVGVAPVSAGGGCHGEDGVVHTEGDATVVRMGPCSFSPTVVHVPAGTEVRFLNTAQVDHLVVGESQTWGTQFALVPGKELARTFAEKGVYPFSCPLHPGMVGAIVVGGSDAAAVPPPAVAGGDSQPVGNAAPAVPAAGAVQGAQAPASQAGPSSAELVVVAAAIAAAAVIVALAWRRQSASPTPSREG
jgi:plastocyanin